MEEEAVPETAGGMQRKRHASGEAAAAAAAAAPRRGAEGAGPGRGKSDEEPGMGLRPIEGREDADRAGEGGRNMRVENELCARPHGQPRERRYSEEASSTNPAPTSEREASRRSKAPV